MRSRTSLARALAVVAVATWAAGCSSSSDSTNTAASSQPGATSTTESGQSSVPPETMAPQTGPTSSGLPNTTTAPSESTGGSSSSDDTAAITAAFTTFFDGVNPDVDGKVAVLENGESMRSMIVDAAANPQFQQLSTVVNSVTMLPDSDCTAAGEAAPCAKVSHDMFIGGLPAMVGLQSHAVKVDGVWKVSAKSWCAIVAIGGETCPA